MPSLEPTVETAHLLTNVLDRAKGVVQMQAQGSLKAQGKLKAERACEVAQEEFARAYMLERMLLVESLIKRVAARDIPTPKNYKEAVRSEFADYWNDAIIEEIRNLQSHGTWKEIPMSSVSKGRKPIDSTWSFRVKKNQKGRKKGEGRRR